MTDVNPVVVLSSTNYAEWVDQLKGLTTKVGCAHLFWPSKHADPNEVESDDDARVKWGKKAAHLKCIQAGEGVLRQVLPVQWREKIPDQPKNYVEFLSTIDAAYLKDKETLVIKAQIALWGASFQKSKSVAEQCVSLQNQADRVRSFGTEIKDSTLYGIMLEKISDTFSNVKWSTFVEQRRSLDESKRDVSLLLAEVQSIEGRADLKRSEQEELMFQVEEEKKKAEARKKAREERLAKIKCFACDEFGHVARNCLKRGFSSTTGAGGQQSQVQLFFGVDEAKKEKSSSISMLVDSGAGHHCVNDVKLLQSPQQRDVAVYMANGDEAAVLAEGNLAGRVGRSQTLIENVWCVPQMSANVLSMDTVIDHHDMEFLFGKEGGILVPRGTMQKLRDEAVCHLRKEGRFYYLDMESEEVHSNSLVALVNLSGESLMTWHERLGHPSESTMRKMGFQGKLGPCITCKIANIKESPWKKNAARVVRNDSGGECDDGTEKASGVTDDIQFLDVLHYDQMGPFYEVGRKFYQELFTDEKTTKRWLKIIDAKYEIPEMMKQLFVELKNRYEKYPKVLQSDQESALMGDDGQQVLKECGIKHNVSIRGKPQQNGRSERSNQTVLNIQRVLLMTSGGKKYMKMIAHHSVLLANIWTAGSRNSQLDIKFHDVVALEDLRKLGCAVVYDALCLPGINLDKLDPRGRHGSFWGFSLKMKAKVILDKQLNKFVMARTVFFDESTFPMLEDDPVKLSSMFDLLMEQFEDSSPMEMLLDSQQVPLSQDDIDTETDEESPVENDFADDTVLVADGAIAEESQILPTQLKRDDFWSQGNSFMDAVDAISGIPTGVHSVMSFMTLKQLANDAGWRESIVEEISFMKKKALGRLFDSKMDQDATIVDSRFHFQEKTDGRKRARWVAREMVENYQNNFAPVKKLESLFFAMSVCATGKELYLLDTTKAFLNAKVDSKYFVRMPKDIDLFDDELKPGELREMTNAMYGTKKAGRLWYLFKRNRLMEVGFKVSKFDKCVFYRWDGSFLNVLAIHVDDDTGRLTETALGDIVRVMEEHDVTLKIENCPKRILGMDLNYGDGFVALSQQKYIDQILELMKMIDCKPTHVPGAKDFENRLQINQGELSPDVINQYKSVVPMLNWVATMSRPDILYTVCRLGSMVSKVTTGAYQALKSLLRYLRTPRVIIIQFSVVQGKAISIDVNCDANFPATKPDLGVTVKLNQNVIKTKCMKAGRVATSTAEAEIMAIKEGTKDCIFFRDFFEDLGFQVEMSCSNDNHAALKMLVTERQSQRTRHFERDLNFIRDNLEKGVMEMKYRSTEECESDILTKPLDRGIHARACGLVCIK